jgi:putative flippase GtrA
VSDSKVLTQTAPGRPLPHVARIEGGRAAKYAMVGVANVTIDFLLYALLVTVGVWYPIAKAVSLTVATANGYTWNRLWTFRAGRHQHPMLARYVTVQAICYVGNVALLAVLIESLDRSEIVAQAIALPVIAGLSFLLQRLWTFRGLAR